MKHPEDHTFPFCEPPAEEVTTTGRRGERDTEYRRRILSAAKSLLETHDIESVTMHQIAKESGVGQGTLYRRYNHIGDVCSDLIKSTTMQYIETMEANFLAIAPDEVAMQKLSECLQTLIDFVDENVSLLSLISSIHAEKRSFAIHKKPFFIRLRNILTPLLERAVQNGEIAEIDVTLTVNTILTSLLPDQYLYHRSVLGYTKQQFKDGICRLFIKGI